jgi:translation initiation factor 5A
LDITDEGFVSLLLPDGSTKDDLRLPEGDLGAQIKAGFNEGKDLIISVISAMGEEAIVACKSSVENA